MKFKSIALLIGILGLALVLVVFLQSNLPLLEQKISFFSLSISLLKCWVFSLLVIAALPSVYFGTKYFSLTRRLRLEASERKKEQNVDRLIAQIERQIQHQDFATAEKYLDRQELSDHKRRESLLGELYLAQGRVSDAIAVLKKAYSAHHQSDAGYLLARALLENRKTQHAADILGELIDADEHAVLARKLLLEVYDSQEMWDECLKVLDYFRDQDKAYFSAKFAGFRYAQLRRLLHEPEVPKKAIDQVDAFLREFPRFVPAYLLLADWYLMQGDEKKAFAVYERGFQATQHSVFLKCLEDFYVNQDRPEDAIQVYRKIRIADDLPVVRYQLGKLFQRLEMTKDSLEILEPLKRSFPNIASLAVDVADLKMRWNRGEEALNDLRTMIDNHPDLDHAYICKNCQTRYQDWLDRCSSCHAWNEIVLEVNWRAESVTEAKPVYY